MHWRSVVAFFPLLLRRFHWATPRVAANGFDLPGDGFGRACRPRRRVLSWRVTSGDLGFG
jgi:hypothetical protein